MIVDIELGTSPDNGGGGVVVVVAVAVGATAAGCCLEPSYDRVMGCRKRVAYLVSIEMMGRWRE